MLVQIIIIYSTDQQNRDGFFMVNNTLHHPTLSEDIIRPTHVEVNLTKLRQNYLAIKEHVHTSKVMPILKANAYGHGLVRTAQLMEELSADYIGVAVLEEGILLREKGIRTPILVLGGILGNQIPHFLKYDLSLTASSIGKLLAIEEAAKAMGKTANVHLKIDTGMERIGVHFYNAWSLIEATRTCKHLFIEGIFSHFANSDIEDLTHARLQLKRFQEVLSLFEELGIPRPPLCHMANSGAILNLPEAHFDMVRPGLLLYGVYPSEQVQKSVKVSPALAWKTRVVYFKVIQPGYPVGYGSTWTPDHTVRAVTLPVGYGDGYFRAMSNKCYVLIRDKKYPVVGTFSMDQIVVNIESDSVFNNDEAILIGNMGNESITCTDLAQWAGTIPYEILTNINTRVPRVYVD